MYLGYIYITPQPTSPYSASLHIVLYMGGNSTQENDGAGSYTNRGFLLYRVLLSQFFTEQRKKNRK